MQDISTYDARILINQMAQVSDGIASNIYSSQQVLFNGAGGNPIAIATMGVVSPEMIDLHFGDTLRLWNVYIARENGIIINAITFLDEAEEFARVNSYSSIVSLMDKEMVPVAKPKGYVIREAHESDKIYITKRLF